VASCVKFEYPLDINGSSDIQQEFLVVASDSVQDCTGYVLLTGQEYNDLPTLLDIFAIPLQSDMQQMFVTGFSTPMIAYLTAYSFGLLINWFTRPRDESIDQ